MTEVTSRDAEAGFRGMPFRRLGTSGLVVPAISLGLWNNFGADADDELCRQLVFTAFDEGVTPTTTGRRRGRPKSGSGGS